jgi:hypothetical protein
MAKNQGSESNSLNLQPYSSLQPRHTTRQMTEYIVTETELSSISLLNTLTAAFFSFSSGAFMYSVGLWSDTYMQSTLTEKAIGFTQFGEVAGLVIAFLFVVAGVFTWIRRRSILNEIKKQSVYINQLSNLNPPTT